MQVAQRAVWGVVCCHQRAHRLDGVLTDLACIALGTRAVASDELHTLQRRQQAPRPQAERQRCQRPRCAAARHACHGTGGRRQQHDLPARSGRPPVAAATAAAAHATAAAVGVYATAHARVVIECCQLNKLVALLLSCVVRCPAHLKNSLSERPTMANSSMEFINTLTGLQGCW